jgi:exonuclease VII large subunit
MAEARSRAALAEGRLAAGLRERLRQAGSRTVLGEERAVSSFRAFLQARKAAWEKAAAGLQGNSPLNVLKKGFAVVWDGAARRPVVRIDDVAVDSEMIVAFYKGEFRARVTKVDPDKPAIE